MQVQNINSNNYKNRYSPNFGLMNVTPKAQKLLNEWWINTPEYMADFNKWKKALSNTKYFDLNIDEINNKLWLSIKNSKKYSSEAPLCVFEAPIGNTLDVYGNNIFDTQDYVRYPLEFATKQDAKRAFHTLNTHPNNEETLHELTPIEQICAAVNYVKILEKACEYMKNPTVEKAATENPEVAEVASSTEAKLPIRQWLKNAWLALKGGKQ